MKPALPSSSMARASAGPMLFGYQRIRLPADSATSGSATSGSPRMTGTTGDAKFGPLRFCTVIRQELVRITTGDRIGMDG